MSNYRIRFFVGAMLLFGLLFWMPMGDTVGTHLAESRCQECHMTDQVTPERARMLISSQEKLCAKCHPKAIQLSHPSGLMPKRMLPPTFPLDWKGELTCSSCHLVHGTQIGLMRSLRRGGDFCRECHDDAFFDKMPDRGASMVSSGHLDARSNQPVIDLDAYSLQCMGCHEDKGGSTTQLLRVGLESSGIMRHMGTSLSHPIGRVYSKSITFGGYRPEHRLPSVVLLPDGKVSCVSCHEGYSKKHGGLTVDNKGSALCLTCHDM
ncbi:MAG: cytochrome c3 family protein [Magnetococcus sp. YQC-5]